MALVRACHVMKKGDVAEATQIAPSIVEKGLEVRIPGGLSRGKGAWAYPIALVPEDRRSKPMVIFDVEDRYVEAQDQGNLKDGRRYFTLRLGGNLALFDHVPIRILGFLNMPSSFPVYEGPIEFWTP